MNIDYTASGFWLETLRTLGFIVIGAYVFVTSRNRVTNERIDALETNMDARIDIQATRITTLEARASAAPTHDDLKRLHQRLDNMNGELKELRGEFQSAGRTLSLIHDYLLNHGGKS